MQSSRESVIIVIETNCNIGKYRSSFGGKAGLGQYAGKRASIVHLKIVDGVSGWLKMNDDVVRHWWMNIRSVVLEHEPKLWTTLQGPTHNA